MNEFEKYPELAEQMQEYAAFGKFGNWQKFTDVLNETLKQVNKNIVLADVSGSLGFDEGYSKGYSDAQREAAQEIREHYHPNDR